MSTELIGSGDYEWRGDAYTLELYEHELSQTPAPAALKVLPEGVDFQRGDGNADVLAPYLPTEWKLGVKDEGRALLGKMQGAPESRFRADLLRGGSLAFRGRVVLDTATPGLFEEHPQITLTAYDAAKRLKNVSYDLSGTLTIAEAFQQLLALRGYDLPTRLTYDWHHQNQQGGAPALHQRFPAEDLARDLIKDEDERNAWQALLRLCTLTNAQFWQESGRWHIMQRSARGGQAWQVDLDAAGGLTSEAERQAERALTATDVTRSSTEQVRVPTTAFRAERLLNQDRRTPHATFRSGARGWSGDKQEGFSVEYGYAPTLSGTQTLTNDTRIYVTEGDSVRVRLEGSSVTPPDEDWGRVRDTAARVMLHDKGSTFTLSLSRHGRWSSAVFITADYQIDEGERGDEIPWSVTLESESAPFEGTVELQVIGPEYAGTGISNGVRYGLADALFFARASVEVVSGEQEAGKIVSLDLERSDGTQSVKTFSLGDDFLGAQRGVMEYRDADGDWQPTRDWDAQSSAQGLHQLRLADRAAQKSAQINGVRFQLLRSREFSFGNTLLYDGTQYIPVLEKRGPDGPREIVAFDLHNFAVGVPSEYIKMVYHEGFRTPRPPRMRIETDQTEIGGTRYGVVRAYPNYPYAVKEVRRREHVGGNLRSSDGYGVVLNETAAGDPYYEAQVELVEEHTSQLQLKTEWRRAGTETYAPLTFDYDVQPEMMSAQLAINARGQVLLSAEADTDTDQIAWASKKGMYADDADDGSGEDKGVVNGRQAEDVYVGDLGQGAVMTCVLRAITASRQSALVRRQVVRPLSVPWPISVLAEGPDSVDFRMTVGAFDPSVTLRLVYEVRDESDALLSAEQTALSGITSEGGGDFTVSKDANEATRIKLWLQNETTYDRVSEYEWRALARAAPACTLRGIRDSTNNEDIITGGMNRNEPGWVLEIMNVGGSQTSVQSGQENPVLLPEDPTGANEHTVLFNTPQPAQSTSYQAQITNGVITALSDVVTLP